MILLFSLSPQQYRRNNNKRKGSLKESLIGMIACMKELITENKSKMSICTIIIIITIKME